MEGLPLDVDLLGRMPDCRDPGLSVLERGHEDREISSRRRRSSLSGGSCFPLLVPGALSLARKRW